jgi:hypothetical protein
VSRWADAYVRRQANEIAETTGRKVTETASEIEAGTRAAQAVDAEELAEAVAAGIEATLTGSAVVARAKTIAATITHAAAGQSSEGSATVASKLSQITLGRQWFSLADGKTRLTHVIANGQRVELGQSFLVGGVYLRFPGDPLGPAREIINCRCAAVYLRITAAAQQQQRLAA